MSYSTPTQFEITTPVLLDAKIAEIQTAMDALSWLTYSFARAYREFKETDAGRVSYPAVYQGDGVDYLNVFPNDNYASHSFVYVRQPHDVLDTNSGFETLQGDISIIVFYRLKQISTTKDYHFSELLKYDVLKVLDAIDSLTINQVFDEIEEAYADFSTDWLEGEFLKEDMGAMRFDCNIKYSNDCIITNSY